MRPTARATAVIALVASLVVTCAYAGSGPLGFIWDDYLLLRPRPWAELLQVWRGSWDTTGIVPVFYRPLAVWSDAAAFTLLGFNETALRAVALIEWAIGGWLIGLFVRREASSLPIGALATALYLAHPMAASSAGPWWFVQNHRLEVIAVACALLAWQSRRDTLTWRRWWPVHALILVAGLFKEDALMLAPVLLALQWWRSKTMRDVPAPTWRFAGAVAAGWAAWFVMRWQLLGAIAGTPIGGPDGTLGDQARHAVRGLWRVFIEMRAMQGEALDPHRLATMCVAGACLAGAAAWIRGASARARLLMGQGLVAALAFNLLVALASFPTRYHLIVLGATLWFCGAAAAWHDGATSNAGRAAAIAVGLVLVVTLTLASRTSMQIYRPCTPANLHLDVQLRDWIERTPAWRDTWILPWLDEKARRCASGQTVILSDAIPEVLADVREGRRR